MKAMVYGWCYSSKTDSVIHDFDALFPSDDCEYNSQVVIHHEIKDLLIYSIY